MRSIYSQITVFVLNAISDVFTNVTYTVIICIKSSKEALFLCVINSSTSRKPKYLLHSITMSLQLVLKIFVRTLVTV